MEAIINKILPLITSISLYKKYKTIKGEDVRILVTDKVGIAPIVGLIKRNNGIEELMCWKANGTPVMDGLYDSDTLMEVIQEKDSESFQRDELIMYQYKLYGPFVPGFYARPRQENEDGYRSNDLKCKHLVCAKSWTSWTSQSKQYYYEVLVYRVRKPTPEEINKYLPADSLLRKLIV